MKLVKTILLSFIAVTLLSTSSCKKSEGDGGKASITGKIWVQRYIINSSGTVVSAADSYPGAYEDVYIIYGSDETYGDKVQANPDGIFEFKYLRPGKYTIYAYSSGENVTTANRIVVMKEVEIAQKKQTVDAGTIEIDR